MRTFEYESILFFFYFFKHICLQDRSRMYPPPSLGRTARMHLKHAKRRQIAGGGWKGETRTEGVRRKIRQISNTCSTQTKTTGRASWVMVQSTKKNKKKTKSKATKTVLMFLSLFFVVVVKEETGNGARVQSSNPQAWDCNLEN